MCHKNDIKLVKGTANSAIPDQTAPLGAVWSESTAFALAPPSNIYSLSGSYFYFNKQSI